MDDLLAAAAAEERQRASRALLAQPLLAGAGHAEALELVQRHRDWLTRELHELTGYELIVRPGGWARLRKAAIDPADRRALRAPPLSRWARRSSARDSWPPFTRKQYVLLALTCAALCQDVRHVSLRVLISRVHGSAADAGLGADLYGADRRSFLGVIYWLEELGAIGRREGSDLDAFRDGDREADALFGVNGPLICDLLGARRPITDELSPHELFDDASEYATADERRNLRGKWRLARRLLETSATYADELDEDERAWWRSKRAWTEDRCARLTGLAVERRREGTMLVEATNESRKTLSDLRFPTRTRESQLALCLCGPLAERLREGRPEVHRSALLEHGERLVERYGRYWRLEASERAEVEELVDAAVELLAAHRLVQDRGQTVIVLPAVARFARPEVRRPEQEAAAA